MFKHNPVYYSQPRITVDYANRCSEYDLQYELILIQLILKMAAVNKGNQEE